MRLFQPWQTLSKIIKTLTLTPTKMDSGHLQFAELGLPTSTTGRSLPARSLSTPPRLSERIVLWIDNVITFCVIERTIILRNIRIGGNGSITASFKTMIRVFLVINVHIWGFWALGRGMKGSTSYVVFSLGGFMLFLLFGAMSRCVRPFGRSGNSDKNMNIKWLQLVIADAIFESAMIIIAGAFTFLIYKIFYIRLLGAPLAIPNISLLALTCAIAAMLGLGVGLMLHSVGQRSPVIGMLEESLRWVIFITSGVYTPYAGMPWYMAQYVWYSPLVAIVEYGRKAFDNAYPVDDLSLAYSAAVALVLVFVGLGMRRLEQETRVT
jgi:ABC-type polysaccharide/polyol phosphate export permease